MNICKVNENIDWSEVYNEYCSHWYNITDYMRWEGNLPNKDILSEKIEERFTSWYNDSIYQNVECNAAQSKIIIKATIKHIVDYYLNEED